MMLSRGAWLLRRPSPPLMRTLPYAMRGLSDSTDNRMQDRRSTSRLRRPPPTPKRQTFDTNRVVGDPGPRPNTVILFPGDYSDNVRRDMEEDEWGRSDPAEAEREARKREKLIKEEEEKKKQKERWLENAKPKDWKSEIDVRGRAYGKGGRKRAVANVWIQPGYGEVVVNKRAFTTYFPRMSDRDLILKPFVATETVGHFDVTASVQGGGVTGQAGAISHGIARALNAYNPDLYRPALKFLGLLTRDHRKVEEKKVGLKKARKAPQWNRR